MENARLAGVARDYAAGDIEDAGPVFSDGAIALVIPKGHRTQCSELCRRLLASGAAKKVVMAADDGSVPNEQAEGTAYSFEQRETCPQVYLGEKEQGLSKAGEILRLKVAQGICVVPSPAHVGEADAVLLPEDLKRGKSRSQEGFNLSVDTMRVSRLSYFQRDGNGFKLTWRHTLISYRRLAPLLIPTVDFYGQLNMAIGYLRLDTKVGGTKGKNNPIDPTAFVTDILKLNLELDASPVADERVATLEKTFAEDRVEGEDISLVIADFIAMVGQLRRKEKTNAEEAELVVRIVADRRIDPPGRMPAAISAVIRDYPDKAAPISDAVFSRLDETIAALPDRAILPKANRFLPKAEQHRGAELEEYNRALKAAWDRYQRKSNAIVVFSGVINRLPAEQIVAHRGVLERLAHHPDARVPAWRALTRLSEFGADAIPTFIYLIDDAYPYRGRNGYTNKWQHPYLAGLIGLCRLGAEGREAVPMINERIGSGKILANVRPYRRLLAVTLARLGADREEAIRTVSAKSKAEPDQLKREFDRADEPRDCHF
jgi:hypothetical protein